MLGQMEGRVAEAARHLAGRSKALFSMEGI